MDTTGHNGFTKRNEQLLEKFKNVTCFDSLGPEISFVNNIYVLELNYLLRNGLLGGNIQGIFKDC